MSLQEYKPNELEQLVQESWKKNNSYKAVPCDAKEKFY
tara:strand:+ start:523 stop:636 length:114 start_codon:yes stop_codon:yes gene_type:complete